MLTAAAQPMSVNAAIPPGRRKEALRAGVVDAGARTMHLITRDGSRYDVALAAGQVQVGRLAVRGLGSTTYVEAVKRSKSDPPLYAAGALIEGEDSQGMINAIFFFDAAWQPTGSITGLSVLDFDLVGGPELIAIARDGSMTRYAVPSGTVVHRAPTALPGASQIIVPA
jgi:hypothetical protein